MNKFGLVTFALAVAIFSIGFTIQKQQKNTSTIDVAIIGGGISGLYSAYRLSENDPSLKINLFEAAPRLGGRIYSVEIPHSGGLVAEMGAMRFPYAHLLLHKLITETLQLPIEEENAFPKQLFQYVRGQKIEYSDYHDHPEKIPYRLDSNEQGKTPDEMVSAALEKLIPGLSKESQNPDTFKQFLQNVSLTDASGTSKPLYQWEYADLVKKGLSKEGFQLLLDTSGFVDNLIAGNAYDILVENASGGGCYWITGGMQRMIDKLADKVSKQGVTIHTEHALTAIHFDPENSLFILTIADKIYYAKKVILTISPRALIALEPDSVLYNDPLVVDLLKNSKRTCPLQKTIFIYDQPWWKELGLSSGRSFTDMSSQQMYYWNDTPEAAMLLASFKDSPPIWQQQGDDTIFQNRGSVPKDLKAPLALVNEFSKQVKEMHAPVNIPEPHTALYVDWNLSPVQGGFYYWQAGVKSWEVMPKLRKPYPDMNLYITGDNYGVSTGVAESIDNVEIMLQHEFRLDPP